MLFYWIRDFIREEKRRRNCTSHWIQMSVCRPFAEHRSAIRYYHSRIHFQLFQIKDREWRRAAKGSTNVAFLGVSQKTDCSGKTKSVKKTGLFDHFKPVETATRAMEGMLIMLVLHPNE